MKKRRTKLSLRQRRLLYMSDEDFSNLVAGLEEVRAKVRQWNEEVASGKTVKLTGMSDEELRRALWGDDR